MGVLRFRVLFVSSTLITATGMIGATPPPVAAARAAAPAQIVVSPDYEALPVGTEGLLTAEVFDEISDPVAGVTVEFEVYRDEDLDGAIDAMALSAADVTGDGVDDDGDPVAEGAGVATFDYTGPPAPAFDPIAVCVDADNDGCASIDVDGFLVMDPDDVGAEASKAWGTPASLFVSPEEETMIVGTEGSLIAEVFDQFDEPVAGVTVEFEVYRDTDRDGALEAQILSAVDLTGDGVDDDGDPVAEGAGVATFDYTGPPTLADDQIAVCVDADNDGCASIVDGFLVMDPDDIGAQAFWRWRATLPFICAGNDIYVVCVDASEDMGRYTARTGPGHPVPGRNVIYGGEASSPGTSYNSYRSFTSGTNYTQGAVGGATNLNPFATTETIGTTGVRTTWEVTTPDTLRIVQDVNVNGTTLQDSNVEVTTQITNAGTEPLQIGVRYLWDWQIGGDDGPTFQEQSPAGPVRVEEAEFVPPGFAFYKIEDNDFNDPTSPLYTVFGSATGPSTVVPPPVAPTQLTYGSWPASYGTEFDYTIGPIDVASGGGDSAVLYWWGHSVETAISLGAGGSSTVRALLFAGEPGEPPPFNRPPLAVDDTATTINGLPVNINVLANDSDPDGDTLTVTGVTQGSNGIVTNNGDGTVTYDPVCFQGMDTFTYTIDDGNGGTDVGQVTVRVRKTSRRGAMPCQ